MTTTILRTALSPVAAKCRRALPVLALSALLSASLSACNPAPDSSKATTEPVSSQSASPATAAVSATKPWWQDAVFYQIWPRSFADSNGDGTGDFNGIAQKLPYLADLGVNALWLTPMFEAPSYHGYDFTEFYQVETDYGSQQEFKALIDAAKAKNIRIILDLVINHISDQHDWFKRSAAGEAPYKDYFIWRKDLPTDGWGPAWDASKTDPKVVWHYHEGRKEYYYAAFGASQPDLNLTHPDVIAEMKKMAKYWLDLGVAGFRLDAVRYAIETGPDGQADTAETIEYWKDFTQYVKSVQPDAMLVGEAWADLPVAAKYAGDGKALDAGFDFEFGYKVLELLQGNGGVKAEFGTMNTAGATATEQPLQANFNARKAAGVPMGYFSPFLTNHDQPRIGWQLQGDQAKAKLAAAMLLTSPGSTYLYYGEEIGLSQASDAEHIQRRAPMLWDQSPQAGFTTAASSWVQSDQLFPPQRETSWWTPFLQAQQAAKITVADQQQDAKSLWSLYKFLITQKQQRAEFGVAGSYEAKALNDGKLLQISRELAGKKSVFVLNLSAEPQALPAELLQDASLQNGWNEAEASAKQLAAWQLRSWSN
ncbi:alpha-amylase family glycosyl hydrolase [Rheinheimera texasensis]|uniref:alpha-amylase family glycosyl hydrolase n=1 Tax=Rheinheimera texasensis TaxID=306205 RepID=UPI0009FCC612|nr:alpha-amylase family glycosyl hydrolase [Rheinheimera texasensis]